MMLLGQSAPAVFPLAARAAQSQPSSSNASGPAVSDPTPCATQLSDQLAPVVFPLAARPAQHDGAEQHAIEFVMSFARKDGGLDTENFEILGVRLINSKIDYEAKFVVEKMVRRGFAMGEKLKEFYHMHYATEDYISNS
ncbi:hypothetical protein M9H77_27483 [Catharanthus roseus]|uniref:Uncharacterized protein n=1 Tax=Catharanthus roseus TaxID=4058 RepID=A0ACC0ACV5_CATRO|nr:hypothetical protein M9H77_27483 [Catharanthus roseus]